MGMVDIFLGACDEIFMSGEIVIGVQTIVTAAGFGTAVGSVIFFAKLAWMRLACQSEGAWRRIVLTPLFILVCLAIVYGLEEIGRVSCNTYPCTYLHAIAAVAFCLIALRATQLAYRLRTQR